MSDETQPEVTEVETAEDYDVTQDYATAESDDTDVESALERETQDGKGGAVVPKSDFDSFATDDVENDPEPDETKES